VRSAVFDGYRRNFVTKHDSTPSTYSFQHIREFTCPVVARKYDGDFLILWKVPLYGVDVSRVGFCLENHVGSCRTPNSELPPPETPISSTTPRLQALSFGTSLLEPDGTEVHILSGALLSSSYLIVCMFFSHICSASHPPPFWEGTSRR